MSDSHGNVRESRRRFFQLLAGSPLLAAAYPALPPAWQEAVAKESLRAAPAGPRPAGIPCPDCGQEMVFPTSATAILVPSRRRRPPQCHTVTAIVFWKANSRVKLLIHLQQAINVWDMEMTTHANNLPQHWAFLHLGVEDFETRKANRRRL